MTIPTLDYRARRARTARSVVPGSWFATHELPPEQRFDAWRQSMAVFLDPSLSHQESPDDFAGEIEGYLLDDIVFSRARSSGQKFDRESLKIAADLLDHYMIQLFLEGHAEVNLHRRLVRNRPGQIIGFDLGDIMDSFNASFDLIGIIVPRTRLSPLLRRPDSLQCLMPSLEDGPGYLLAGYLQTLYNVAPSLSRDDASSAATALVELIAAAFNSAAVGPHVESNASGQSQLLRAQLFIRENLGLARLSSDAIASNIGVSRSTLYQLFESVGGVAGYVRELRLRKCLTEIASPRHASRQIAEIAYGWGFSSPAVFARAFRRRFGRTPSEARSVSYAQVRREQFLIDPRAGNRLHEEWIAGLA